jgi:DNA primase catalytic core
MLTRSGKNHLIKNTFFVFYEMKFFPMKQCNYFPIFKKEKNPKILFRFFKNKIQMKSDSVIISKIALKYGLNLIVSGKSYKTLCPFHAEKTPSFLLNDQIGAYHCFGCGASGNSYELFKYLESKMFFKKNHKSKKKKRDFNLTKKNHSNIYYREKTNFSKLISCHSLWLLQITWGFFMGILQQNKLLKVLIFSRGVSVSSSQIYGLGYAPGGRNLLFKYLNDSGLKITNIIRSGLVYSKRNIFSIKISIEYKKNEIYNFSDVFQDRIIIPIRNNKGVIIGFGGRNINKNEFAKYINSSDSGIFRKKKSLFSEELISASKHKLFRTMILTEGYLDSIGLFQNGIKFSSASLGTSFKNFQIRRLHLLSCNCHVIIYFDLDNAGDIASKKILDNTFEKLTTNLFCISMAGSYTLKDLKDPDDFLYFQGSSRVTENILNCSLPIMKWLENKMVNSLFKLFNCFLCSNKHENIHKNLFEVYGEMNYRKFFRSFLSRSLKFFYVSNDCHQLFKKKKFLQIGKLEKDTKEFILYSKNTILFEIEKFNYIRYSCNFNSMKNLFFLFSFMFPVLKDDLIQISFLNGFFFLDFIDKCSHENFFNNILNLKSIYIWNFYQNFLGSFFILITNPKLLKNFLFFHYNSEQKFSIELDKDLDLLNEILNSFFFSYLGLKEKKIIKKLKTIIIQFNKIKYRSDETGRIVLNPKLEIIRHRKNRDLKIGKFLKKTLKRI